VIELAGVTKTYGDVVALAGVDLEVSPGETLALLGPNGAGKTTLVSIVAGVRKPDAGSVHVLGADMLRHARDAQPRIGFAPQALGVYNVLSVRQNLITFGELSGLRGARLRERVAEVAEALGLADLLDRRASALSGGQQRRLHTAIALIHEPLVVLLDEPTAGADIEMRARLLELVKRLAAERGAAVCYCTHYLREVEELDASVALLDDGRIVARGTVDELIASAGRSLVELRFAGIAPQIDFPGRVAHDGSLLTIECEHPEQAAGAILAALGAGASRLESVNLRRPTLETAYLALTGRAYPEGGG
jgi:ABC-2 type transport system ATP-binding protein